MPCQRSGRRLSARRHCLGVHFHDILSGAYPLKKQNSLLERRTSLASRRLDGKASPAERVRMGRLQHGRTATADAGRGLQPILLAPGYPRAIEWLWQRFPAALLLVSSAIIVGTWFWLGAPTASSAPPFRSAKLNCVSYAPYRGVQDPLTPG